MSANLSIEKEILDLLKTKDQTIAFAESCTGGLISSAFVAVPGISEVFLGSVVSYADSVKEQVLGVTQESLQKFGAVSEIVVRQMAQGVRVALNVDWSLAVTGIAGPSGGTPDKPVGTVWFAVVGPSFECVSVQKFNGDREGIRSQTVQFAFKMLRDALISN